MDTTEALEYGIDREKGLSICMNRSELYRKILGMFINDGCFEKAKAALAKRDYKEMFARMHELKGSSGNIALTDLYKASAKLVEILRAGDIDEEAARASFSSVEEAYSRAVEGIRVLLSQND